MSTWHQRRNPQPLWHETLWTVVSDPPEDTLSVMRFGTRASAEEHLANHEALGREHAYIIPPRQEAKK